MSDVERPAIEFVDVEKVLLSIAPQDADGRVVTDGVYDWTVIDQVPAKGESGDVVALEVAEDGLSAWAISGVPGKGTIVVHDSKNDLTEHLGVTIKFGAPSALNLSAGTPVPEA